MITKLEDFKAYNRAIDLGQEVWNIVGQWDKFSKYTVGTQLVKAVDSVAANLSEGLSRFFVKEIRQFGYYARGSLFETKTWLQKAFERKLISQDKFSELINELEIIGKMINTYIKSLGTGLSGRE